MTEIDFPLTRQLTPRLLWKAETGSTNADLRAYSADDVGWPHLSTLVSGHQTSGRGRLDRVWSAPAGASLAISVLLRRLPRAAELRGWIPLIAGVAMSDAVATQLTDHHVAVKWPNDVLVDGRKICGILAEATADAVILGAGVNTAMTVDQLPMPTATSCAALGVDADEDRLLADYLRGLDRGINALVADDPLASGLHEAVTRHCATIGQRVRVILPGDRVLEGDAVSIDGEGRLIVEGDGETQAISAGDVVHVRPADA